MFWAEQTAVLERVAAGHPLSEILADIVRLIERQADGMRCSLLLLDGKFIRHGAAPSLPPDYVKWLDGQSIGPRAGSCGTAAYVGRRVIVEDITTDPLWDDYRTFALPFGLRACWSSPIFSAERDVLGTFAMYYGEPRRPTAAEITWVDAATHLAAIAIVSDRATKSLLSSEARSRRLARLYAMSSAINEAIVRETDTTRLYETACRIAVDHGMARLAWIGIVNDAKRVIPVAHAGIAFDQAWRVHEDLSGRPLAADPVAEAVREGRPGVCNDIAAEPRLQCRDVALRFGLHACAAFPLRRRGTTAAILFIYSEQTGAFGEEEMRVLSALAEDIAFAVESAQTAAALRQSEERLRALIEQTPDVAIQWYDERGRLIFYNAASRRLFGWRETEALGHSLLELGFWDAAEEARFAEARDMADAGKHVPPTGFRFRRPDGTPGALLSTVFRIPLSESQHCYVCMDVDLTEHQRMEAAVRAGEAIRALIYDSVTDMIFYVAVEEPGRYRFESVNRAFLETTGLREDQVAGHLIDDVIPRGSLPLVKAKYAEAIATGERVVWEEISRYPRGVRHGEVTVTPMRDVDGTCRHLIGTVHDLTERRQAERQRQEIQSQLEQAQRLQALGTFAGGIAHDFNNLLAAINGNLTLALDDIGTGHPAHEALADLGQAADRATRLVRQILTFGRKSHPVRERLELRPIVEEALKLVRVGTRPRVTLRTTFTDDIPAIEGDSTQVHQALVNLITNATQAIGDGDGTIDLRVEGYLTPPSGRSDLPDLPPGHYARVTVTDDGPGMDESTMRRVFEPFFTTKDREEGTGLGLSVVHGIMKSHGGAVAVSSQPKVRTTFELLFPARASEGQGKGEGQQPKQSRPPESVSPAVAGKRVLFIDEDEATLFLAKRAFVRRGHEISAYAKVREALNHARNHPGTFDVVVADAAICDREGSHFVSEIRRICPGVHVVMTATYVRPEDLALSEVLQVNQIIAKPQSLEDLAKLIERSG